MVAMAPTVPVRLERAFIETADHCDAFVTQGTISQQLMPANPMAPVPGPPHVAIAFEITSDEWVEVR